MVMVELFMSRYVYLLITVLLALGLYGMLGKRNLLKKLIGMNIFQTAIFLFYISLADITGGTAPIIWEGHEDVIYTNPVPHCLILTAIVVSVSTTAVALALIIRIYREYGSIEEDVILAARKSLQPEFSEYARQKGIDEVSRQ